MDGKKLKQFRAIKARKKKVKNNFSGEQGEDEGLVYLCI